MLKVSADSVYLEYSKSQTLNISIVNKLNFILCENSDLLLLTILLFLFQDLPHEINRMCGFLNKDYTEAEVKELADHLSFDSLRKNKNVNNTTNGNEGIQFVRKGEAGGWRTHFDEKQQIQAEDFLMERLKGLDLKYPSFPIHEITRL